jgi:hypothetical protein
MYVCVCVCFSVLISVRVATISSLDTVLVTQTSITYSPLNTVVSTVSGIKYTRRKVISRTEISVSLLIFVAYDQLLNYAPRALEERNSRLTLTTFRTN